jgi:NAD(P)-dependent dehydrogenase (short-subunit alcohol dehydrogenase family)
VALTVTASDIVKRTIYKLGPTTSNESRGMRSLAVELSRRGLCVNARAPEIFPTAPNSELPHGSKRGRYLLVRAPTDRYGLQWELAGSADFLASQQASFVLRMTPTTEGGYLVSDVTQ